MSTVIIIVEDELLDILYRCHVVVSLFTPSHLLTEVADAGFGAVPQERLHHDPRRLVQVNHFVVLERADLAVLLCVVERVGE